MNVLQTPLFLTQRRKKNVSFTKGKVLWVCGCECVCVRGPCGVKSMPTAAPLRGFIKPESVVWSHLLSIADHICCSRPVTHYWIHLKAMCDAFAMFYETLDSNMWNKEVGRLKVCTLQQNVAANCKKVLKSMLVYCSQTQEKGEWDLIHAAQRT